MKTYFEFITEVVATKRKSSAKVSKPSNISTRNPFIWVRPFFIGGWWHPVKQWSLLPGGDYHVAQIVRRPKDFGVSHAELLSAAESYSKSEGLNPKYFSPQRVLDQISEKNIDMCYDIQMLAYSRGWLKVYGGESLSTIEGSDKTSIRAALREIQFTVSNPNHDIEICVANSANKSLCWKRHRTIVDKIDSLFSIL